MEEKPTLTKIAIKRIIRDIQILNKSKDNLEKQGIYFHYPDDNIGNMKALIIGTDGTPYEGGFYFFDFEYPSEYPKYPPKIAINRYPVNKLNITSNIDVTRDAQAEIIKPLRLSIPNLLPFNIRKSLKIWPPSIG